MTKPKREIKELPSFEGEVYLWAEQQSSIMLKAATKFNDPVELTADDAKSLAKLLMEAAADLDDIGK